MRRSDKVTVDATIRGPGETIPLGAAAVRLEDLLDIQPGESVPKPETWHRMYPQLESYVATLMEAHGVDLVLHLEYPNPAYDTFPGTVALLPDHEPSPNKVLEVRFELTPTIRG